jgi:hypothetical protein
MERKDSNNTVQTNSTEKKQVPGDWLPTSGGRTKSSKLTGKEMDAEFQKMLEEGVIDGISPNRSDTEESERSIENHDTYPCGGQKQCNGQFANRFSKTDRSNKFSRTSYADDF